MIDVTEQWWPAVVVAAVAGAVGGLVCELLQTRLNDATGMLERWSKQSGAGRRFWDLGFLASVIVGAVAAVAFLYFVTPTETVVVTSSGHSMTTREYDGFKLIAASLIVGSAGAFLLAMQERVMRLISETELTTMTRQADAIIEDAKTAMTQDVAFAPGEAGKTGRLMGMLESLQQVINVRH